MTKRSRVQIMLFLIFYDQEIMGSNHTILNLSIKL
uniref:Uncharacterized protein n=1 Tax=Rhizophora mucronata TaxID=61149 RepID=A0A2P2Q1G8_RHIMU